MLLPEVHELARLHATVPVHVRHISRQPGAILPSHQKFRPQNSQQTDKNMNSLGRIFRVKPPKRPKRGPNSVEYF